MPGFNEGIQTWYHYREIKPPARKFVCLRGIVLTRTRKLHLVIALSYADAKRSFESNIKASINRNPRQTRYAATWVMMLGIWRVGKGFSFRGLILIGLNSCNQTSTSRWRFFEFSSFVYKYLSYLTYFFSYINDSLTISLAIK